MLIDTTGGDMKKGSRKNRLQVNQRNEIPKSYRLLGNRVFKAELVTRRDPLNPIKRFKDEIQRPFVEFKPVKTSLRANRKIKEVKNKIDPRQLPNRIKEKI